VTTAADYARRQIDPVRDDPAGRVALLERLYGGPRGDSAAHLPFRRAALAFMNWQVRRGLLNPISSSRPGSPWWRGVNERLLRDGWEASGVANGLDPAGSTSTSTASLDFIRKPTARNWYRAHNASVVAGYLDNLELAGNENRTERFFINLVLVRVLYAHALVSNPRLALGRLAPLAPRLGDPRLGMTGLFLSISRILPATYPLNDALEVYIDREQGFGRLLDVGVIQPRFKQLYEWSAVQLGEPRLRGLLLEKVPSYAWPIEDRGPWFPQPTLLAGLARRVVPVSR